MILCRMILHSLDRLNIVHFEVEAHHSFVLTTHMDLTFLPRLLTLTGAGDEVWETIQADDLIHAPWMCGRLVERIAIQLQPGDFHFLYAPRFSTTLVISPGLQRTECQHLMVGSHGTVKVSRNPCHRFGTEVRRHRDRSLFGGCVFVKLSGHVANATAPQAALLIWYC